MEESALNRVLFRSGNAWVEEHKVPPEEQSAGWRAKTGADVFGEALREWEGTYHSADLDMTWRLEFADGSLWVVPSGEAAQLLSPNGRDGLRCRGVNLWFERDAFILEAVDELTADTIEELRFDRTS
jgi:hypothetical protein